MKRKKKKEEKRKERKKRRKKKEMKEKRKRKKKERIYEISSSILISGNLRREKWQKKIFEKNDQNII